MERNIYKLAAQKKMRFPYKGMVQVEDLFDLSLTALDEVYKNLAKQVKKSEEESLLKVATTADEELEIKLAIVKEIFIEKQAALEAKKAEAEKKAFNQKIAGIIAQKKEAELQNMSIEELEKLLK